MEFFMVAILLQSRFWLLVKAVPVLHLAANLFQFVVEPPALTPCVTGIPVILSIS
jgi:hypothetical protein